MTVLDVFIFLFDINWNGKKMWEEHKNMESISIQLQHADFEEKKTWVCYFKYLYTVG